MRMVNEKTLRGLVMEYKDNKHLLEAIEYELSDSCMSVTAAYGDTSGREHKTLSKLERAVLKRERLKQKRERLISDIHIVDLAISHCLESDNENHHMLFTVLDSEKGMRTIGFDMGLTHRQVRTRFDNAIAYACERIQEETYRVVTTDTP